MTFKDGAIGGKLKTMCECCLKVKICKLYVIPTGEAAWICKECREGNGG